MFERIIQFLRPISVEEDITKNYQMRLLHAMLLFMIVFSSLLTPLVNLIEPGSMDLTDITTAYTVAALLLVGYILLRYGYQRLVSYSFIAVILIAVTFIISTSSQGAADEFVLAYILPLSLAALTLSQRDTIITTLIVLALLLGVYSFVPVQGELLEEVAVNFFLLLAAGLILRYSPLILRDSIGQLQIANENLRLFVQQQEDRVQERTRDLTLAFDIANSITQIRNVNELLDYAVEQIRQQFDLYYAQIYLADASERTLNLQAGTGSAGTELVRQGHRLPIGLSSINGEAAYYKKPVLIVDTQKSSRHRANALLPDTKSELAVPLIATDRVLGVLDLQASDVAALNDEQIQVFQILANQLAGAIENANLFTQVTQTQELLTAQAQLLSRSNWEDYLGNVEDPDRFRAYFSKEGIESEASAVTIHDALYTTPISVTGEAVGFIQIENAPNYQWTVDDANLVKNVAQQVAQRIENLRLLYEAERYRDEAEQALRRLTKETWDSYVADAPATDFFFQSGQLQTTETARLNRPTFKTDLQIRGEAIGQLAIKTDEPLNDETSQMVAIVANQLSNHLENIRLTKQTEQRVAELAIINDITNAVQNLQELDELLETIGNRIKEAFNPSAVYIALYNSESQTITFPYYVSEGDDGDQRIDLGVQPLGNNLTSQIITNKQTIFYNYSYEEMLEAGAGTATDDQQSATSFIGIPILSGTEVLGVVSIQNDRTEKRALTNTDLDLIETITASIGVAIQNTRLFEQTQQALAAEQKQSNELALINRVVTQANQVQSLEEVLRFLSEELLKTLDIDQVGTALFSDDKRGITTIAMADKHQAEPATMQGITMPVKDDPIAQEVLEKGHPVIVNDIPSHPLAKEIQSLQQFSSMSAVPLIVNEQVLGTIALASGRQNHPITEEHVRIVEQLLFQVAASFDNLRLVSQLETLLQEAEQQAERLVKLNQMNTVLSQASSVNEVYEAAVAETAEIFQTPHVSFIHLIENTNMAEVSHVQGIDNEMPPGYLINIEHDPIGEALQTGKLARISVDPPLETILSTPVIANGRIIGALNIGQTLDQKRFNTNDESLLLQIASLLNSIVENKYLLTITQQRAEKERLINDITQKIQNTVTVENALQVAIEELGRAFKATNTKVELGIKPTNGTNGHA